MEQLHTPAEARAATPPVPPGKKQKHRDWPWYLAAIVLAAAVTAGAVAASSDDPTSEAAPVATTTSTSTTTAPEPETPNIAPPAGNSRVETPLAIATQDSFLLDAAQVGDRVIPSVVTVQITGSSFTGQETVLGSGSGVVYDNSGHIITNDHVVAAGSSYEIVLADGRIYPATVVGTDPATDLAVLEVTAQGLPAIALGDSDALTVGDPAVAVGSPLGLDGGPSLTVGVISAFGRQVQTDPSTTLYGMLQTDAPITSGSSGGALVDSVGRLVGITTAVGVSPVGVEGIGFATPVEIVTRVADEIIATGSASSPFLGIWPQPALEATADGGSIPRGIEVTQVDAGTAAAAAGITEGDIIAAIDGAEILTFNDLIASLRRYGSGDTIEVTLQSGEVLSVTLGQRPDGQ